MYKYTLLDSLTFTEECTSLVKWRLCWYAYLYQIHSCCLLGHHTWLVLSVVHLSVTPLSQVPADNTPGHVRLVYHDSIFPQNYHLSRLTAYRIVFLVASGFVCFQFNTKGRCRAVLLSPWPLCQPRSTQICLTVVFILVSLTAWVILDIHRCWPFWPGELWLFFWLNWAGYQGAFALGIGRTFIL